MRARALIPAEAGGREEARLSHRPGMAEVGSSGVAVIRKSGVGGASGGRLVAWEGGRGGAVMTGDRTGWWVGGLEGDYGVRNGGGGVPRGS